MSEWRVCAGNKSISYRGPVLDYEKRLCPDCGQVKYCYLRAYTYFTKQGAFWKLPSKLAKRINGIWYGVSGEPEVFNHLLRATSKRPPILCSCVGKGGLLTRRVIKALATKQAIRLRHARETLALRFSTNQEHNKILSDDAGDTTRKSRRNKLGNARPRTIGGFGGFAGNAGNIYGISRGGIDGVID